MTFKAFCNIFLYPFRQKGSGVDCDVIIKKVNAHLTVGKHWRLTNEIIDYKIVALSRMLVYVTVGKFWGLTNEITDYKIVALELEIARHN
jgi:hypothetical protein